MTASSSKQHRPLFASHASNTQGGSTNPYMVYQPTKNALGKLKPSFISMNQYLKKKRVQKIRNRYRQLLLDEKAPDYSTPSVSSLTPEVPNVRFGKESITDDIYNSTLSQISHKKKQKEKRRKGNLETADVSQYNCVIQETENINENSPDDPLSQKKYFEQTDRHHIERAQSSVDHPHTESKPLSIDPVPKDPFFKAKKQFEAKKLILEKKKLEREAKEMEFIKKSKERRKISRRLRRYTDKGQPVLKHHIYHLLGRIENMVAENKI